MQSTEGFMATTPKVAMMPNSASSLDVSLLETKVINLIIFLLIITHILSHQVVRKFATPLRKADPNI